MECFCDPSFVIPPPCSLRQNQSCLEFTFVWLFVFGILFLSVCYELYHQILKKYSKRLNLKFACYLGLFVASAVRVARFVMLVNLMESVLSLDVMYYLTELFIFASYSSLYYVWVMSYIVAHSKPEYWLWCVRVGVIYVNASFWVAMYTLLVQNPYDFTNDFTATIIVGAMLFSGGAALLVLAKTMQIIAKDDTELIAGIESVAQKISKNTYYSCVAACVLGVIFLILSCTAFYANSVTFFIVRHSIYRILEIGLIVGMLSMLHQKPRKPNSKLTSPTITTNSIQVA